MQYVFRWPIIIVALTTSFFEAILYLLVRGIIYSWESFTGTVVPGSPVVRDLTKKLDSCRTLNGYRRVATALDGGGTSWKYEEKSAHYNHLTVRKTIHALRTESTETMMDSLSMLFETLLRKWGVHHEDLYARSYFGTKRIIQELLDEIPPRLQEIRSSATVGRKMKAAFFAKIDFDYGKTALCLSGGANLTYVQFGAMRKMIEHGCLPKIINGASGGALVGSLIAVRTDEECLEILTGEGLSRLIRPCDDSFTAPCRRLFKTGYVFNQKQWRKRLRRVTRGDITFMEAFQRTGRIFSVVAVSGENHEAVLLNVKTSPNVVIWSAVLASSSLPWVLPPQVLYEKVDNRVRKCTTWGERWFDGSIKQDIPVRLLKEQFNVKYTIVVQCNPHCTPQYWQPQGEAGYPSPRLNIGSEFRGGFFLNLILRFLQEDIRKWIAVLTNMNLIPALLGPLSPVLNQHISGDCTMSSPIYLTDLNISHNPTVERWTSLLRTGESMVLRKFSMIQNRMMIQNSLEAALRSIDPKNYAKNYLRPGILIMDQSANDRTYTL